MDYVNLKMYFTPWLVSTLPTATIIITCKISNLWYFIYTQIRLLKLLIRIGHLIFLKYVKSRELKVSAAGELF